MLKVNNKKLLTDGHVVLDRFLTVKECRAIEEEFLNLLETIDISKTADYPKVKIVNHTKTREIQGNLGNLSKPVLLIRGHNGFDDNMIELFKAEKLINLPVEKIKAAISSAGFYDCRLSFSLYYNDSISNTRGYHRDASPLPHPLYPRETKKLYKFFMYVTDVFSIDQGPYSYISNTHSWEGSLKIADQFNGSYLKPGEKEEHDIDLDPKIFLGKAGLALISDQAGFHRGLPQSKGSKRIMLVCKIRS